MIAQRMTDGQIGLMAVTALAERLNMFQRGVQRGHMQAAHPARHPAVQLAGDGVVNFLAGVG